MNTFEKPTVPTPATLAEINPALTQGNIVEVPPTESEQLRPVLGGVATREEYRNEATFEPRVNPEQFVQNMEAATVTLSPEATDDKAQDELSGFTVTDATQNFGEIPHDTDELPDELKDELGEPDNDEVDAA